MPTIDKDNPCVECGSEYANAHRSRSDWCVTCGDWLTSQFLLKSSTELVELSLAGVLSRFDVGGVEMSRRDYKGDMIWESEFRNGHPFKRTLYFRFTWNMPSRGDWWRDWTTGIRLGGVEFTLVLLGRMCSICGKAESVDLGVLNSKKVHESCVEGYEAREADPGWRSFKASKARMHAIARGYGR